MSDVKPHGGFCTCPVCFPDKPLRVLGNEDSEPGMERWRAVAPATEPPRETRRSMAVIVYGAFAAGGALVGLVAGWVLRGMW